MGCADIILDLVSTGGHCNSTRGLFIHLLLLRCALTAHVTEVIVNQCSPQQWCDR
jgi:hypothetical protein